MSISEMFEHINSLGNKNFGHGARDRDIADAESELGVRFPASYRAFLSTFGSVRVSFDMLYGLGPDVPSPYELVKNVLCERYEAHPHIPKHLLPILNDGAGNHYCLDTAAFQGNECPVVFWDHEHPDGADQTPEHVSASFDLWLIDLIDRSPYAE
jgi:cell wall assembly regulator SMI1